MPASTRILIHPFLAVAVALAFVLPTQHAQAVEPADNAMTPESMMQHCKDMQARKQQMMADLKVQDTALSEQVAQLNSAADDKKLVLLTALVTRMAEQRIANNAHMQKMGDGMMQHMTQHMRMGKDSMSGCPMMKGMQDMKGKDDKPATPAKPLM